MTWEIRTHESIREIDRAAWNAMAGANPPPFVTWEFLDLLERTGCVRPERGWLPLHLSLHDGPRLVAVAPAYVKGNSEGEFVFDHAWARFAIERLRLDYYPKLIVAVPFTPATGPRLLVADGIDREAALGAFVEGLRGLLPNAGLSSAHVLFPTSDEARALGHAGMIERHGIQFHWTNPGYASFEEFLARFSSKRRNQIRRERREVAERGVLVETLDPDALARPETADLAFRLYLSTVEKYVWGRQYLTRAFFEQACATIPDRLHLAVARDAHSGRPLAGAFNLIGGGALYGRYWGALEDLPFLHFEVCFYHGIADCIAWRLERFEPGAGGEHKLARGFEPTVTYSAHLFADPRVASAVADFVARERDAVERHVEQAQREPVLKPLGS